MKPFFLILYKNLDCIFEKHKSDLKSMFGIEVDDDNLTLFNMYWLPKKHKVPSKAQFIVAASLCSRKPLAKALTSIFKLFYKQIENYNKKVHFFSGIKPFWVIQDKQPVIKAIRNLNKHKVAKSVMTFDFSTRYTKIPHDKLKDVMNELVDFCFKGCYDSNLLINDYGAFWSHGKSKDTNCLRLSKIQVKLAISYLLDNCYFRIGDAIFKQRIGIPMGSDPAPFMANLFLYHYESSFLKELKKTDLSRARRFGNVFRFIDDLSAINDGGEFERCYLNIYPVELELKKENQGTNNASFLDIDIFIHEKVFSLKLYDKRDAFPFSIVRLPFLSNNMPSRVFYATLGGELLRIARCTTNVNDFCNSCQSLVDRVYNQGAQIPDVKKTINKAFNNHYFDFSLFFNSVLEFRRNIFLGTTLS